MQTANVDQRGYSEDTIFKFDMVFEYGVPAYTREGRREK